MKNRKITYFWDMDGVVAKWSDASIEETFEPGFFSSRIPEKTAVEALKSMFSDGYDVRILSAAYVDDHSVKDKKLWLKKMGLDDIPRIFVPYGKDKHEYIRDKNELNVLIDDFTRNLKAWKLAGSKYMGIKFMNGINGTKGTWDGYTIHKNMDPRRMETAIVSISEAEHRFRA